MAQKGTTAQQWLFAHARMVGGITCPGSTIQPPLPGPTESSRSVAFALLMSVRCLRPTISIIWALTCARSLRVRPERAGAGHDCAKNLVPRFLIAARSEAILALRGEARTCCPAERNGRGAKFAAWLRDAWRWVALGSPQPIIQLCPAIPPLAPPGDGSADRLPPGPSMN